MPIDRSQLRRMIDSMERAMTRMECDQKARHDAEDREYEEQFTNPLDAPPCAPFSDSPPAHIHGYPRKDLFK
jgi:hypothetical protein